MNGRGPPQQLILVVVMLAFGRNVAVPGVHTAILRGRARLKLEDTQVRVLRKLLYRTEVKLCFPNPR